jgi:hypothetical protein
MHARELAQKPVMEIPLTHGLAAIVDDEDFARANRFKWSAKKAPQRRGLWYAYRIIGHRNRSHPITEWLHHFIQGSKHQTDHRDGNGLNNQKNNLRHCNFSQNSANRRLNSNNSTGFKGVTMRRDKFIAQIGRKGAGKWIGSFDSSEEAARAYDNAAVKRFGEFARLNFPIPSNPINARS